MIRNIQKVQTFILFLFILLSWTDTALATQSHGEPEGLYSHMLAHVIFFAAMAYLCIRLIRSGEYARKGWRWIFVSAFLFALWNLNTIFVHSYRETLSRGLFTGDILGLTRTFHAQSFQDLFYYFGRLDHLLSLPALLFLYLGIRTLYKLQGERR